MKFIFAKINFFEFLLLLISFVYGNLFVIDNSQMSWNFLIIFSIVFFLEFLNKIIYFLLVEDDYKKINPSSHLGNKKSLPRKAVLFSKILLLLVPKQEFWKKMKFLKNNLGIFKTTILTNSLKRGFLLGFFIEAFKVGS